MKNFRILFALFVTLMTVSICQAQSAESIAKKVQLGINIEGAFPTGDFSNAYSFGIGGSLMGRYALSDKANLTASLGYLSFTGKK